MLGIPLLLLLGLVGSVWATTWRVPADYATIQAALDALSENDTVLVDTGNYAEALLSPSINFVMRGNVVPDTGDYPRPVIDPSPLPNPRGLACLRTDSGSVVIEDMMFRNRLPMYPHTGDTTGGIRHAHGNITMRRCVFDSTFNALWAYWADVTVSECDFRNLSGIGIRSTRRVVATDCDFESNMVLWAQLSGWGHSRVERCRFSGHYQTQSILTVSGDSVEVRDCVFGPGDAAAGRRFLFFGWNSVFENNVIEDWEVGQGIWDSDVNGPGPLYVRHNVIRNCIAPPGYPFGLIGFQLEMLQNCDSCFIAFDSNEVVNCSGNWGAPGVFAWGGNVVARFNRFTGLAPVAVWSRDSQFVMRDNLIYGNGVGLAVDSGVATDARWNWWGDSTGPYHNVQNPNGQGDTIQGDRMLFSPWYTDTTFFGDATPERGVPLPREDELAVYPNPFNPSATLRFHLKQAGQVTLAVFNISGQQVKVLLNRHYDPGDYTVTLDAKELPSGIYFARINAGDFVKTEKLMLLK